MRKLRRVGLARRFGCRRSAVVAAVLSVVVTVGVALRPSVAGAAGAAAWTVEPSADATNGTLTADGLSAVSCVSSSDCWAAGGLGNSFTNGPLLEHWDGSAWQLVNPAAGTGPLVSISCDASTDCWAVAQGSQGYGLEHGTPAGWALSANTASENAVTCLTASDCWAVGSGGTTSEIQHYDGRSWTDFPAPSFGGALNAVTCASTYRCVAVGTGFFYGATVPYVLAWDGTSWSFDNTVTGNSNDPTTPSALSGVACDGLGACFAAGDNTSNATPRWFIYQVGGNTSPQLAQGPGTFRGISCGGAFDCAAVGTAAGSSPQPLVVAFDGSAWTPEPSVTSTGAAAAGSLVGVSCAPGSCQAVGNTGANRTLAETGYPPPPPSGYRLVARDGGVFSFGDAAFYGSTGGMRLNQPIVAMAPTPGGNGYWLAAADGGVFSFGDAAFYGSMGGQATTAPIVGMSAAPGRYDLLARDGTVYEFQQTGGPPRVIPPGQALHAPAVGISGGWIAATDGEVTTTGPGGATYGSMAAQHLNAPIVAIQATPDEHGYWLAAADGGVFAFGDAAFYGSTGNIHLNQPIVGMAAPDTGGYWLIATDGGVFSFGDAPFYGSTGSIHLNQPIVGAN